MKRTLTELDIGHAYAPNSGVFGDIAGLPAIDFLSQNPAILGALLVCILYILPKGISRL
ncbi:MAG: hypothetical protein V3V13_12100 [Paracoccaceae bacterium]